MRFPDRVVETTETTGTGTYDLLGAASGYDTFVLGAGSGNQVFYICQEGTTFEIGFGTVTAGSPATLTRNLLKSSTGSLINWAAGTRTIFCYGVGFVLDAMLGGFQASTRPAWLPAGQFWKKTNVTPWEIYLYTGTTDLLVGTINVGSGSEAVQPVVSMKDSGAGEGPIDDLFRDSTSAAAADLAGARVWSARTSTGVKRIYAKIRAELIAVTNGAEDAALQFHAIVAGALTNAVEIWKGLVVGTGETDQGAGTVNVATGFFEKGWQLTGTKGTLIDGATINWDMKGARIRTVTLGGNRALANPTNKREGVYYVFVTQDGAGGRTLSYGSDYKFRGGVAPVLSTAIGAVDMLIFVCDGTSLYGACSKEFS